MDAAPEELLIYESEVSHKVAFDILLPFEACGPDGFFTPLKWKYLDGEFTASLFELAFPHAQFTFKRFVIKPGKKR